MPWLSSVHCLKVLCGMNKILQSLECVQTERAPSFIIFIYSLYPQEWAWHQWPSPSSCVPTTISSSLGPSIISSTHSKHHYPGRTVTTPGTHQTVPVMPPTAATLPQPVRNSSSMFHRVGESEEEMIISRIINFNFNYISITIYMSMTEN